MKEIVLDAKVDNLPQLLSIIDEELENAGCSMKGQMQIDVAVEEIFVNVASYAYEDGNGSCTIQVDTDPVNTYVTITFIDEGIPYNPLAKEDPDVTLSADEREIGGLGIFIVKKSMDKTAYERKDNKNVFSMGYSWA
ncbi:MAG: ATP-binding protein [Butyrivibrio sp.]|nr:ATP-binding protein [Butyrivibrio sp.]